MALKTAGRFRALTEADKLWSVVSAVSAAIAAVAAFLSVQQARETTNDSRLAGRPYFLITNERIDGSPLRLSFTVTNLGARPAADVHYLMLAADLAPSGPPTLADGVAAPNDVGPTEVLSVATDKPLGPSPVGPQNVIVAIRYRDPVLNRRFSQVIAFYWKGEGQEPVLFSATREAKDKMFRRFAEELRAYKE